MSQQKISVLTLTRTAAAAVTVGQLVSPTGAVATAGGAALGATTIDAASGASMSVDVMGTTILVADGAITDGAELEVGTAGKAKVKNTGRIVAIALQAAASGAKFEALLIPGGIIQ
jgi:hypothetical protein